NKMRLYAIVSLTLLAFSAVTLAQPAPKTLEQLLDQLSTEAVMEHAYVLSQLGSRVTGYEGYYASIDYIASQLNSLGLNPEFQNFTLLVPMDRRSLIRIPEMGIELKAYAVWPNGHVGTWDYSNLTGKLVYVGEGRLEDFDGREVEGAIIVMDFCSGDNWRYAAKFGAKAVVFIGASEADRYEAYSKFEWYAFYPFVRLYVEGENAERLIECALRGYTAVIDSQISLEIVEASNLLVKVPGRKQDEAVLVVASIDSWSVVPALARSVHDALNVGFLLELARIAAQTRFERSLWIAFLSGHWQGLVGARHMADSFALDPDLISGRNVVWYVVGVDFSDDFPGVSLVYMGHFYRAGRALFTAKYSRVQELVSRQLSDFIFTYLSQRKLLPENLISVYRELGLIRDVDLVDGPDWSWTGTMATPYLLDTEPFVVANMIGFTVRTQFSFRNWEGVPGTSSLRWSYIVPQLYQAAALILQMLTVEEVGLSRSSSMPSRFTGVGGGTAGVLLWGLVSFKISVASFNLSAGWYTPVSDVVIRAWSYPHTYPFACTLKKTRSDGIAEIVGLSPQGVNYWLIEAIKVEGDSVYVVDQGVYGVSPAALIVGALQDPMPVFVPVFKGGIVVLFDIVSPRLFRTGAMDDPRMGGVRVWYNLGGEVKVYDTLTKAEPMHWSSYLIPQHDVAMVAAPIGSRIVIAAKPENPSLELRPLILLTNSTENDPEGLGVQVKPGFTLITTPALAYSIDTFRVAHYRYFQLKSRGVRRLSAEVYEKNASWYISAALNAIRERKYSETYRYSLLALSFSARYYAEEVMPLYDETARTAVLMLFIVLPSAYLLERLLVHSEGLKRILAVTGVGVTALLVFTLVHPAMTVLANSAMSVLGTSLLMIALLVLAVFSSETSHVLRSFAASRLGFHEFKGEETSAALMSISTALENMRKRPLRSVLTLISITTVAVAVVSLTSTSPAVFTSVSTVHRPAAYEGLVVRRGTGVLHEVLGIEAVEALKGLAGSASTPRVWLYPVSVNKLGPYGLIVGRDGYAVVQGVLGLNFLEADRILSHAVVNGSVFHPYQMYACLLTTKQARLLGVTVGDEVEYSGFKLTVVGILNEEELQRLPSDPDGYSYIPLDPTYSPTLYGFTIGGGQISLNTLAWDRVLIATDLLALKLGGFVNSVGVIMGNSSFDVMIDLARKACYALDAGVSLHSNGTSITVSRVFSYALFGWEFVIPLLALGSISIVVTLLAAVYERSREMLVFSAVGLSPRGASLMFIVEFLVYGLLSAFIGYVLGWTFSWYFICTGLLPETYVFNYASAAVILALIAVVSVCLVSALYPALKASQLITPSLERVWKPPTKPRGDLWEIVFPLRLTSRSE
ncbi:MAG: FtsX-like permease family protein, partial [Thermofilaceae archaeon]